MTQVTEDRGDWCDDERATTSNAKRRAPPSDDVTEGRERKRGSPPKPLGAVFYRELARAIDDATPPSHPVWVDYDFEPRDAFLHHDADADMVDDLLPAPAAVAAAEDDSAGNSLYVPTKAMRHAYL